MESPHSGLGGVHPARYGPPLMVVRSGSRGSRGARGDKRIVPVEKILLQAMPPVFQPPVSMVMTSTTSLMHLATDCSLKWIMLASYWLRERRRRSLVSSGKNAYGSGRGVGGVCSRADEWIDPDV